MKTREDAVNFGLSFPDTYLNMPFHDDNWQLIRYKGNSKGELSGAFAFGGADKQRILLEADCVAVDNNRVDLKK